MSTYKQAIEIGINSVLNKHNAGPHANGVFLTLDFEEANGGRPVLGLLGDAACADGMTGSVVPLDYAEHFGEGLALLALGVSGAWFDEHGWFPLMVPYVAYLRAERTDVRRAA